MDRLLVVVIDSGTGRKLPLVKQLENRQDIKVELLAANMLRTVADLEFSSIEYSEFEAKKYLGRSMSLPEVGCASSHNQARLLLAASPTGGVILEDDARICNLESFVSLSNYFLSSQLKESAVLNLSNPALWAVGHTESKTNNLYFVRGICPTPLAVGYVATSQAAFRMLSNNSPIKYVSDWPSEGVSFYSSGHGLVHHGDSKTVSTIDPAKTSQRSKKSYLRALSIIFGIDLIFHFIKFGIDTAYFRKVWWVTFSHKISFLRGTRHYVQQ